MRTVRRELASGLRDITQLLGLPSMCHYLVQFVAAAFAHMVAAACGGGAAGVSGAHAAAAAGRQQEGRGGGGLEWLPLESGVYAANVVLGRHSGEEAGEQVGG